MTVFDIRDELPRTDWEIGRFEPKNSRTYHWNGPALPTDVGALDLIFGDAYYHVSKDWSPEPGIQGGDGIMYHKLIAPNGDLYIARDPDAVLWACGSALGNAQSEHVQVMCGVGQSPTAAQFVTMRRLEREEPLGETYPHRIWSNTSCPGPEIGAWIGSRAWTVEDDVIDRDTFNAWFKEEYEKYDVAETFDRVKAIETTLTERANADDQREADQIAALAGKADKEHRHTATTTVS